MDIIYSYMRADIYIFVDLHNDKICYILTFKGICDLNVLKLKYMIYFRLM